MSTEWMSGNGLNEGLGMKSPAFLSILVYAVLVASLAGCDGGFNKSGSTPLSSGESSTPSASPVTTSDSASSVAESSPETTPASHPPPEVPTSAAPQTWVDIASEATLGVARISTTLCEGASSTGTGFLIAEDLIVTAAHVVRGQAAIAVLLNGQVSSAAVLGRDDEQDIALIRTARPLNGHTFTFSTAEQAMGEEVAAFGYPWGQPIGMTKGTISGSGRHINTEFGVRDHLLQTDASLNPGNSGGPLLALDGTVAGVVSARYVTEGGEVSDDMNYAVAASAATGMIDSWAGLASVMAPESCKGPDSGGSASFPVIVQSDDPSADDVAQVLFSHGQAINRGAYAAAFDNFFSSTQSELGGLEVWSQGLKTSYWTQLTIQDVNGFDNAYGVTAVLQTQQAAMDGPEGQTCSNWSMQYELIPRDGKFYITEAKSLDPGGVPASCS